MPMRNEGFAKTFTAAGEIGAHRIVAFGDADAEAKQAEGGSAALIGVSDELGAEEAGEPIDVILDGIAYVELGGEVTRGKPVTADSDGKAVEASDGDFIVGYAMHTGTDGDLGSVRIVPSRH